MNCKVKREGRSFMIKARLIAIFMAANLLCSFGIMGVSAADNTVAAISERGASSEENIPPEIRKMMTVLKTFKIIPDYYDYNLPLSYEVPRSDFAASVARMMGKTSYSGTEVYFYDVPKNYWAFNEISILTEMGILNGTENKIFAPGEPITKSAAYKILLCAMGYRGYAEGFGGYPAGYTTAANRIKLSDGATGGEKVTMSDMLHILFNALTVNIMEPGYLYGDSVTYEVSDDETLISSYRDIYYGKGYVNGANSVIIGGGTLKKGKVLIDSETYNSEGFNMIEYLGERIEFFYEDKGSSDEKKLLWVGRKDSSQDIKYVSVDFDAHLDSDTFTYTYFDEKEKKHKINLDRSVLLVYNGGIVDSGYETILNDRRYELKLVSDGGKYTVMVVREYENYIADTINSTDRIVYDKNKPQDFINLDESDYDTFSIKLMGNEEMSFEDIKKGAVLTVYKSKDEKHMEVYVSYNSANGIIEQIDNENNTKVTINGVEYRVDDKVSADNYDIGDNVTAYLNVYGEIVFIKAAADNFQGAFLLKTTLEDHEKNMYIKLLGEDSKVSFVKCAEKLVIDGTRYKDAKEANTALLAGGNKLTAQFALIKKDASGEIKEIDTTTYNQGKETSNSLQIEVPFLYDSETTYTQRLIRATAGAARIGEKIVFDENTKIFVAPFETDYDDASDDDFFVTVGSKLANDTGAYAESYKTAENIGVTKYVLLKAYDPSRVNAEMPILAEKITHSADDDGNTVEVLEGYQGVSHVSIKADESVSKLFSENGVLPGDVVTVKKDSYGKVKSCTVVYDYRTGEHRAITALNDITGMFVGYAHSVVDNVVRIGFTSGAEYDFAINAMAKPVVVYDTSQTKNPVSQATTSDIVTYQNDKENCSTVFIGTNRMQPQMFIIYK